VSIKGQYSSDSLSTFGIIKCQYVLCKECEGAVKGLFNFSAVGQNKLVTCKRRCMNYRRKIRLKINMLGSYLQFMFAIALLPTIRSSAFLCDHLLNFNRLLYLPSLKDWVYSRFGVAIAMLV
jgi:hypothetical protein